MFPRVENVKIYEMLTYERRWSFVIALVAKVNESDFGVKIEYSPHLELVEVSLFKLRRIVSAMTILNVPENEDYEWIISVDIGKGFERCGIALSHGKFATVIPLNCDDADVSQMITCMIEFVTQVIKAVDF